MSSRWTRAAAWDARLARHRFHMIEAAGLGRTGAESKGKPDIDSDLSAQRRGSETENGSPATVAARLEEHVDLARHFWRSERRLAGPPRALRHRFPNGGSMSHGRI